MTVFSMTGFGRADGEALGTGWSWEIRSVNGKSLDIRMRVPNGLDGLEQSARKLCSDSLTRGNLQVSLNLSSTAVGVLPTLNRQALEGVISALDEVSKLTPTAPPTAAEILALRGVMELAEPQRSEDEQAELIAALLKGLEAALASLNQQRQQEGSALKAVLEGHLERIESLTEAAEKDPSRHARAIAVKLREQLDQLNAADLDDARLYQEAALLATKSDIREELDRLKAHGASARQLLANGSPVGRKLEFLAQEFNREANTLCSKSNAVAITEIGLELKVVIDQFREQILNVE